MAKFAKTKQLATHAFARYVLGLKVSERDKARMHDLAVSSQDDALTPSDRPLPRRKSIHPTCRLTLRSWYPNQVDYRNYKSPAPGDCMKWLTLSDVMVVCLTQNEF
jgi:hypothetical protein